MSAKSKVCQRIEIKKNTWGLEVKWSIGMPSTCLYCFALTSGRSRSATEVSMNWHFSSPKGISVDYLCLREWRATWRLSLGFDLRGLTFLSWGSDLTGFDQRVLTFVARSSDLSSLVSGDNGVKGKDNGVIETLTGRWAMSGYEREDSHQMIYGAISDLICDWDKATYVHPRG